MSPLLLAAAEDREASPIALVLILGLGIAVVLLIRSMNKHLRRVPARFPTEPDDGAGRVERAEPEPPAGAAERRADDPREPGGPANP